MIKTILTFVGAFVCAMSLGVIATAVRGGPPATTAAENALVDSLVALSKASAADSLPGDSSAAAADSALRPLDSTALAADGLRRAAADSLAAQLPTAVMARAVAEGAAGTGVAPGDAPAASRPASAAARPTTVDTTGVVKERRLAKIFAAMQAKDAARVLQQMDDNDVGVVLGYLAERQAAAILGNFPSERAAQIGRLSLRAAGGAR
ncbi:MAG TPA: hypothetical protein VHQ45_00755 [Gemmatimonadaceae bacterium]|nr:hypothetical protein [Gemmatimonadaceae bacterium]